MTKVTHHANCSNKTVTTISFAAGGNEFVRQCEGCGAHTQVLNRKDYVELDVSLFKPSGKWAYSFVCVIKAPDGFMHDVDLLDAVDEAQTEVTEGVVKRRHYIAVIKETKDQMQARFYQGFLTRLIFAEGQ